MREAIKDEATFEDNMVDVMVLEEPQNMYQALEKSVNGNANTERNVFLNQLNSILSPL